MPLITDVIDVPDFIGYVRDQAVLEGPSLEPILPTQEVDDIVYELTNLSQTIVDIASYRSFDTPPPLGRRQGFNTIRGEILPMGKSYTLNEREMARLLRLQQGLAERGALAGLYNDGARAGKACAARFELARADLLTDGIVNIAENGAVLEANFNVPGAHIVAAAIPWSTYATAVPRENFKAWQAVYRANNSGADPDFWLMSEDVMSDLMLNASLAASTVMPGTIVPPGLVTEGVVRNLLTVHGVAPILVFKGRVPTAAGGVTPTLGIRKVIGVRRGMGNTLYGIPPVVQLLQAAGVRIERQEEAGVIAYVESEVRPARVITTAEGMGLPVLRDPNSLFVATV